MLCHLQGQHICSVEQTSYEPKSPSSPSVPCCVFEGDTNGVKKFAVNSYTEWGEEGVEFLYWAAHQLVSVPVPCLHSSYCTLSGLPAVAVLSPHADISGGQGARGGQGVLGHVHKVGAWAAAMFY